MKIFLFALTTLMISTGFAKGGGHSIGLGLGLATPSQDDLNNHIDTFNTQNSVSVGKFGTAMEYYAQYAYGFSGTMFAMVLRPTFFTQSAKGGGAEYTLNGYSFFPMLRIIPLENNFIKFYMQTGVGYGKLTGKISHAAGSLEYGGGAFGAMAGLGAEFCFTPSHCVNLEGNFRYLPIERNIVSSSSLSTTTTTNGNLTSTTAGSELEYLDNDLKTTMSGIQGIIGYVMHF